MSTNEYHFITRWRVAATCREVYDILSAAENLPRWWPSVYLDVTVTDKGDENSIGKKASLYTKGWLPYTLRWNFEVYECHKYTGFSIKAFGDFEGRGIWHFEQDGDYCNIIFDWKLEAEKPLLKRFSFLMKPIFSANHRWAMAQGEKSLLLELRRTRGEENVPPPPPPTFAHNLKKQDARFSRKRQ
ncbi:SRPBCC family protein [Foetidibacter luteolus]|uniref:SRPBCC family protein n=1 Tax=Foetidibacter luteolus TaxID=2608880 RepID=UPI00129A387B|nr:SRPBCC family protein [Foetidibacter luteolus]